MGSGISSTFDPTQHCPLFRAMAGGSGVNPPAQQLVLGKDDYAGTLKAFGATSGVYFKWDGANDRLEFDGGSVLFKAVASGDAGATVSANGMTADPETAAEAGFIDILIGSTTYQIPIYAK